MSNSTQTPKPEETKPAEAPKAAEAKAPVNPVVKPFPFDEAKCELHLKKVTEGHTKYVGKKLHNPFIWLRDNLEPLAKRFFAGERTEELQKAILALPLDAVPKVVDDEAPSEEGGRMPKLEMTAQGIKIGEEQSKAMLRQFGKH